MTAHRQLAPHLDVLVAVVAVVDDFELSSVLHAVAVAPKQPDDLSPDLSPRQATEK